MQRSALQELTFVVLVLPPVITGLLIIWAAGTIFTPGYVFLAPSIAFVVYAARKSDRDPDTYLAACFWASLVALIITVLAYRSAFLVGPLRSTSGLALMACPVYSSLGGYAVAEFLAWLKRRRLPGRPA
jgi:hypothetical protein